MWKSTSILILKKFNFEILTDLYVRGRYLRENDGTRTRDPNTSCKFSRKWLYGSHEFHCCSTFSNQQWSTSSICSCLCLRENLTRSCRATPTCILTHSKACCAYCHKWDFLYVPDPDTFRGQCANSIWGHSLICLSLLIL
jgi:hypothetical protein